MQSSGQYTPKRTGGNKQEKGGQGGTLPSWGGGNLGSASTAHWGSGLHPPASCPQHRLSLRWGQDAWVWPSCEDTGPGCWVSPCRRWVSLWSELPYHSADLFSIKPPQRNSQDLEAVPASPEWLQMFISNPGHSSSSRPLRPDWTTLKKFMTSSGWTLCLPR